MRGFTSPPPRGMRFRRSFRLGQRAMHDEQLADVLDRSGIERVADALEHHVAGVAIFAEHPNLDEPMRGEVDVDLVQHRGRQAVVSDHDHGMQVMRLGPQGAALHGGELELHARTCFIIAVLRL